MTSLLERRCRPLPFTFRANLGSAKREPRKTLFSLGHHWRGIVWALLAAGLVFCHGCHNDEDNELCAPLTPQTRQVEQTKADFSLSPP